MQMLSCSEWERPFRKCPGVILAETGARRCEESKPGAREERGLGGVLTGPQS